MWDMQACLLSDHYSEDYIYVYDYVYIYTFNNICKLMLTWVYVYSYMYNWFFIIGFYIVVILQCIMSGNVCVGADGHQCNAQLPGSSYTDCIFVKSLLKFTSCHAVAAVQ